MKKPVLWLAVASAVGVVAGVAWPPPPIPRAQQVDAPWSLPATDVVQRDARDDFQAVRRTVAWQGDRRDGGSRGADGEPDNRWRLAGLVADPSPVALVLRGGESSPVRLSVGDTLPDGSTVRDIRHDGITTESEGCRTVYRLHRQAPVETSGDCAQAAAAEPGENAT